MLLNKSRGADHASFSRPTSCAGDAEEPQTASSAHTSSQCRSASDLASVDSAWTGAGPLTPNRRDPRAVSPSPVQDEEEEEEEEDETVQAVASLLRDAPSPLLSPLRNTVRRVNTQPGPSVKDRQSLRSEVRVSVEDVVLKQQYWCYSSDYRLLLVDAFRP